MPYCDDEHEHTVYIDYAYGGRLYEHAVYPNYRSSMRVGDTVEIKLMSENPEVFDTGNVGAKGIAEILIGIILVIGGVYALIGKL